MDPDQLLRMFRRVSYRSALTATLATRLVPVLARDATRMGDAARCRPHPPGRLTVARAALSGRARPRGGRGRRARGARLLARRAHRSPAAGRGRATTGAWARAAAVIALAAVAGAIAGLGTVEPYPTLQIETGPPELALSAGVVLLALAPFAGRAARMGVAHA